MPLIHKQTRSVILRPRDPQKYTSALPSAKPFVFQGSEYLAVPHRPDETLVLRNMGLDIPSPMNLYYEYKAGFKPFEAQKTTAEFASMNRRCFILNSMGLGKTVTTLWAYDYLRSIKQVRKALVICPLSVMERTWADEVFRHFPHLNASVLYGTKERRLKLLEERGTDIYIINTDAVGIIKDAMHWREDIDLIVIDEVALFRNKSTERWAAADEVCNKQFGGTRRVWGLTGSPMPNSPVDAYGQIKLVTPANSDCPKYYGRFRDLVMLQKSQFRWEPKPGAAETVYGLMKPAIRFALDDVVDLPPQIVVTREVAMPDGQLKAYKDMLLKLKAEFDEGLVSASNEAVKASKLLQISMGVAYGEDGAEVEIGCKPRLDTLAEAVDESEGKVIVFVPFSGALRMVKEFLEVPGRTVAVVDGSTSKAERDAVFHDFQNRESPRIIVANPGTMSHGLTLTAATTVVWFGPVYSNEIYQQACARVRRPSQTRSTVIVHLVSNALEERIYRRLSEKQGIQGALLDLVRDGVA